MSSIPHHQDNNIVCRKRAKWPTIRISISPARTFRTFSRDISVAGIAEQISIEIENVRSESFSAFAIAWPVSTNGKQFRESYKSRKIFRSSNRYRKMSLCRRITRKEHVTEKISSRNGNRLAFLNITNGNFLKIKFLILFMK